MATLRVLAVLACLALAAVLQAHDPGLSSATLWLQHDELRATLTFAPADLEALAPMDLDGDNRVSDAEFEQSQPVLESLVRQGVRVQLDGQPVEPVEAYLQRSQQGGKANIEIRLRFPVKARAARLSLECTLLRELPPGHRHYVQLFDEDSRPSGEALLDAHHDRFEAALSQPGASFSFTDFVALGVEHILTGYDHLLFLFGLLVVGVGFASAAKIITSFTVAHSISLALATFGLVRLAPAVVEPLIALSIAYVGVENLVRNNLERRWLLTFGFGLIHGLGFASVLRELGVASSPGGALRPLLGFNLGVEMGQIGVAAAVLPFIWSLGRKPQFARCLRPAASVMVTLLGAYWLYQRIL